MLMKITSREEAGILGLNPQDWTHWLAFGTDLPANFESFPGHKLHLDFDDVTRVSPAASLAGYRMCTEDEVLEIIRLAYMLEPESKLLINCAQGISRSTAAGFIIRCIQLGAGHEKVALDDILAIRKIAMPNLRMVELAEDILQRGGRMVKVVETYLELLKAQPRTLITDLS